VRRPQDTPHPRRSRGTLSHDRVGKGAGGEEAVACRACSGWNVWERRRVPGADGPDGSSTPDPGESRTRDPKGQARLTPTRGWRWSMGPVANGQATVGNPPHTRRGAACVTHPCRQVRVCHSWRAEPVEAPSPRIAPRGTPSTFSL